MKISTKTLVVAVASLGIVLSGFACSGGSDTSAEATKAQTSESGETPATREAPPELATAEFRVEGMTCGGCAVATEMAVERLDGVESADAEYDEGAGEGRCTVTYDPSVVDTDRIAAAIEGAGFTPSLARTSPGSQASPRRTRWSQP